MGEVYCARKSRLGREVAVKILRAREGVPPRADDRRRFPCRYHHRRRHWCPDNWRNQHVEGRAWSHWIGHLRPNRAQIASTTQLSAELQDAHRRFDTGTAFTTSSTSCTMLRLAFAQLAEELKPRDEPTEMDTGERSGKQHRRVHSADGTTAVATAVATRARRDRGTPRAPGFVPCDAVWLGGGRVTGCGPFSRDQQLLRRTTATNCNAVRIR